VTLINATARALLVLGLICASILLIRFAISFSTLGWPLAIPFWVLVVASLVTLSAHVFTASRSSAPPALPGFKARLLLCAAIPIGFLASSLDCMGLAVEGCSSFCTFVKLVWIPAVAAVSASFAARPVRPITLVLTGTSFVPLAPHCVCYNAGNSWWIDLLGRSPECYAWGFVAGMIIIGSLWTGRRFVWSGLVAWSIIGGALAFFVGHHYFGFPW
jgi:hypothetical protein